MVWIILPNQLFNLYKKAEGPYVLWEHPAFFTKYKFNKKKLMIHRASMRAFYDKLKREDFDIKYIEFDKQFTISFNDKSYDPINSIHGLKSQRFRLKSPNFLLNDDLMKEYRKKTKHFRFTNFYMWTKDKLNIIRSQKSTDSQNREVPPTSIIKIVQKIRKFRNSKGSIKYIDEAEKYVNKHFPNNYGNCNNFKFPITRREAMREFVFFIENKFKHFGSYQDYTLFEEEKNGLTSSNMFHSLLSSSLNLGLLNPGEIIEMILNTTDIPLNSKEAFIRQLFWREYQRYTYIYVDWKRFLRDPYLKTKINSSKKIYNGTTKILAIDTCIKKAFDTAYLHHIERLMFVGNYFSLIGLSPKLGFKWFMEFSCDSYEWVMYQNVLDMVFLITGGLTTTRPYSVTSNYIRKMSNIKQFDKEKTYEKIDDLYDDFVKRNKRKLYKFRYYLNLK